MTNDDTIVLYHSPQSRSSVALTLLEELGAPYELRVLNMKAGENRQGPYLAVNPLGKVPAIWHRGALVTEQVAVDIYLADLFPQAGLTPGIDDPRRGPYLRWLAYYGSCFEPALVDKAMKREPAPPSMSTYSDFDSMLNNLIDQLSQGPYLLGEKMTAADVQWGLGLWWSTMFKIVPEHPVIAAYIERMRSRPAFVKVAAMDEKLAAEHTKALEK
jgi:glutathione S-transferase